ncbi:hypothetical protein BJ912DRAFT_866425 [Pholiota molesta]|nr:hypothetical protein BJ912DRAFT_866425 [Pholiota molesta]
MPSIAALLTSLNDITLQACTLQDIDKFIRVCVHFKPELKLHTPLNSDKPPHRLPAYFSTLLIGSLSLDAVVVASLWSGLQAVIWKMNETHLTDREMMEIDCFGTKIMRKEERLGAPTCKGLSRVPIKYYTASVQHGVGARRGFSSSLRCEACKIRYYHNYYTQDGTRHYYSSEVPASIQIEDHAFIESELCELFTSFMLFAWVSSQNCANILNASITRRSIELGSDDLSISSEQVFRAFTFNALMHDCSESGNALSLPDIGDHDARLKCAMELRNKKMISAGQKEKMHACTKCEKFINGTGYKNLRSLRAVVTDGDSIGRPCCKVHNCTTPLPTNRDHFCASHADLKSQCVVTGCLSVAEIGFQTCTIAEHRAMEDTRKERGKAFFQLRSRLNTQFSMTQLPDSMSSSDIPEIEDGTKADNTQDAATRKSDAGNKAPKARFARRRTHNEQLLVSCCGIVLARGTMFGAEAISGVKDFLKSVYPCPEDLPDVIFYDNNCHLQAHLAAQKDEFFKDVMLPVDVFHFKSKHSIKDVYCQRHCNPARWPQLADEDGKWVFNSSAAEQVNAWLGGYLAIVRDMLAHRFDFFLDEMIKRRNEATLLRLKKAGETSYYVPPYRS